MLAFSWKVLGKPRKVAGKLFRWLIFEHVSPQIWAGMLTIEPRRLLWEHNRYEDMCLKDFQVYLKINLCRIFT
jgi:hypothetical protein